MLAPSEFFVGKLADAKGLTLMLPGNEGQKYCALIAEMGDEKNAFFLEGPHNKFLAFECTNNDYYSGILVPDVSIELCTDSVNLSGYGAYAGMLVRRQDKLFVVAQDPDFRSQTQMVPLLTGLPDCTSRQSAAFKKWQIVLGQGVDKRVLYTVSLDENAS